MQRKGFHFWFATWFGTGLSPYAPGTVGTLATLPLHLALIHLPNAVHVAAIILVIGLGTLSAQRVADDMKVSDPQIVVIDESAGILLALWIAGAEGWMAIVLATLLFRALDMIKPWPISAAEKLKPAGVGIMADDVVAGVAAGLVTWLLV